MLGVLIAAAILLPATQDNFPPSNWKEETPNAILLRISGKGLLDFPLSGSMDRAQIVDAILAIDKQSQRRFRRIAETYIPEEHLKAQPSDSHSYIGYVKRKYREDLGWFETFVSCSTDLRRLVSIFERELEERKVNTEELRERLNNAPFQLKEVPYYIVRPDRLIARIASRPDDIDIDEKTFPDSPENHWAYEAVLNLKKAGLVFGQPLSYREGPQIPYRKKLANVTLLIIEEEQRRWSRIENAKLKTLDSGSVMTQKYLADLTLHRAFVTHLKAIRRLYFTFELDLAEMGLNVKATRAWLSMISMVRPPPAKRPPPYISWGEG